MHCVEGISMQFNGVSASIQYAMPSIDKFWHTGSEGNIVSDKGLLNSWSLSVWLLHRAPCLQSPPTCGSSSWRPPASWPGPWWCQVLTEGWIMTECFHWQIVGALDSSRYPVAALTGVQLQVPWRLMPATTQLHGGDGRYCVTTLFSFIVGIVC